MREIKFRAWSPRMKVMLPWATVEHMAAALLLTESTANVPMQFTGLKDKNGVEIYEGDIVRQTHNYAGDTVGNVNYHAILGDTCGWKCGPFFYLSSMHKEIEVIGNIYENPELLKTPKPKPERVDANSTQK